METPPNEDEDQNIVTALEKALADPRISPEKRAELEAELAALQQGFSIAEGLDL